MRSSSGALLHRHAGILETQKVTLAGFRILDPRGVVIAGRDEAGRSRRGLRAGISGSVRTRGALE
jgi:hypothetical protein